MDTTRAIRLGWTVETDTASWIDLIAAYRKLLHDPNEVHDATRAILHLFQSLTWFRYIEGKDKEASQFAHDAVKAAKEFFFGSWRSKVSSGNYRDQPPDAKWWHEGDFFKLRDCTESMMLASCNSDWDFIQRMAEHILDIPWQNIRDGREENSLRMVLAAVIAGRKLNDKTTAEFIKTITTSKQKKENLLLLFLLSIVEGGDSELQAAADAYFDYFLKVESKRKSITDKIMIEGTLYVNLARHLGRKLIVPEKIGERYVQLPTT